MYTITKVRNWKISSRTDKTKEKQKMKKRFASIMFLGLALLGSCSRDAQEPEAIQTSQHNQNAKPISLVLEGDLDGDLNEQGDNLVTENEEARAFAFEVASSGSRLKMTEENIPSVAIIANEAKTRAYYISINWSKTKDTNHLYYKDQELKTDLLGQTIDLDLGNKWYITGYLGGNFNPRNRRITYDPNGTTLQATSNNAPTVKNVPVFFPWTPLEVKHYGTSYQLALSGENKIRFKTLGMLMRITLRNDFSSSIRVKNLKYQTNALTTTSGYYDLSINNLPSTNITNTLPSWNSDRKAEPTYTLADAQGTALRNLDIAAGATYSSSFLVWAMPNSTRPNRPVTHVMAEVSRLNAASEETLPKMSSLYVWGSTNMPRERSRRRIVARIYREKMSLEYFAKTYVGHDGFNVANQAKESAFASGTNIPLYTYTEATKTNAFMAGWRTPRYAEARGLYLVDINNPYILDFSGNGRHTTRGNIRVNGEDQSYTDIYQMGSTIYALRFDGNNRKLYSAWRYTFNRDRGVTIEAVYLGPNYKGNIDDIRQTSFWTLHANDIVRRFYVTSLYSVGLGIEYQETSHIVNFWCEADGTLGESYIPQRRWYVGVTFRGDDPHMSHIQYTYSGGNTPQPSTSHVIPIQSTRERTPTWND